MRYEVYRNKNSSDADFNTISDIYKRIMSEDKYLCIHTQKNLNSGVFVNGELHPNMEKGPLHFQNTVREVVTQHHLKEQAAGHEIWPAQHITLKKVHNDQDNIIVCTAMDDRKEGSTGMEDTLRGSSAMAITV